jgi:hypothetical protein
MKLDFQLFEVLPDELHHRKWVCSIIEKDGKQRVWRDEYVTCDDDNSNDNIIKQVVLDNVFRMFQEDVLNDNGNKQM